MLLLLGRCNGNKRLAEEEYGRKYPTRRRPSTATFGHMVSNLRNCGRFTKPYSSERRRGHQAPIDELVLAAANVKPHQSTRSISHELDISHTIGLALFETEQIPSVPCPLAPSASREDPMRRIEFCMFMREKLQGEPDFLEYLLMSDEATFHRDGHVNIHNSHYWSPTNPHWLRESGHQIRF